MRDQFDLNQLAATHFVANKSLDLDNEHLSRIDTTIAGLKLDAIDSKMDDLTEIVEIARGLTPTADIDFSEIDTILEQFSEIDVQMVDMTELVSIVKDMKSIDFEIEGLDAQFKKLDFEILGETHRIESILDTGFCPYSGKKLPKVCREALIEE
jgi:hypothetical protein